jgi:hypothetical protein
MNTEIEKQITAIIQKDERAVTVRRK